MPRNGSGTYNLPSGNPVVTGTTIDSTVQNNTTSDIATALTNSLAKDGQTTPTANLPMGGFKLTGLASGSARTDSASIANIQDGTGFYAATVGGTSDVITLTPAPAFVAYTAGQLISFISSGANTTNVTVNISGLGAKAVTKNGATALVAGDIPASALIHLQYDGTQFQLVNVNVNPVTSITGLGTGVATALAVNVGSAGAPVVLNGAGGTPSSLTLTNATGLPMAAQSDQETATSTTLPVTPGRQQYHPSASKAWIRCDMAGTINSSYNITSITDTGTGVVTITIATDFSSANWCPVANIDPSGGGIFGGVTTADIAAGSFVVRSYNTTTQTPQDASGVYAVCFGDQA